MDLCLCSRLFLLESPRGKVRLDRLVRFLEIILVVLIEVGLLLPRFDVMELKLTRDSLSNDVSKLVLVLEDALRWHLGWLVVGSEDDWYDHWLWCGLWGWLRHDDLGLLNDLRSWLLVEEGIASLDLLLKDLDRRLASRQLISLRPPDRLGLWLLMGGSNLVEDAFELVNDHLLSNPAELEAVLNRGGPWVASALKLIHEDVSYGIDEHGLREGQAGGLSGASEGGRIVQTSLDLPHFGHDFLEFVVLCNHWVLLY